MSTPYVHVDFVSTDGYSTQRARELSTSAARSHASRVTHLRKKKPGRRRYRFSKDKEDESRAQVEFGARIRAALHGTPASPPALASVPYTVNHFIDNIVPNIVSLFDIFKVKVFWDDRWLSCVSQEPYYSAFSAAQQLNRDEFNHPDSSTPSVTFLEHKLRAIQIVRQKLTHKTDVDDTTLLAMMKLGFVEARLGDLPQYDVHKRAMNKIIQDRRGVESLDPLLAPMAAAHDLYHRMHTTFPVLPAPAFYGPFVEGKLLNEFASPLIDDLPTGFQVLAKNGKIPLELLRALHRTNQLLHNRSQPPSPAVDCRQAKHGADTPETDLYRGFWAACPSLLSQSSISPQEPDISNLLSLGLWLYAALEFSTDSIYETLKHWISIAHWIRQDLTNKLRLCVEIRPDDEESCLKWLISIAIQSWRGPDQDLPPEGFTLNSFRKRRFQWLGDMDEGFFMFTKGTKLDTIPTRPRVHKGIRTHSGSPSSSSSSKSQSYSKQHRRHSANHIDPNTATKQAATSSDLDRQ